MTIRRTHSRRTKHGRTLVKRHAMKVKKGRIPISRYEKFDHDDGGLAAHKEGQFIYDEEAQDLFPRDFERDFVKGRLTYLGDGVWAKHTKVKKGSTFTSGKMHGKIQPSWGQEELRMHGREDYIFANQYKNLRGFKQPVKYSAFSIFGSKEEEPKNYIDDFGKHYVFPNVQAASKFADSTGGALQQVKKKDKIITEVILP